MSTYTYRNTTDKDLAFVGVGLIEAGETITTEVEIVHAGVELVKTPIAAKSEQTVIKEKPDGK